MTDDGYAAVTSRAIADKAGLKSKIVHYYFQSMDDLFIALFNLVWNEMAERHKAALEAENPLRTLWDIVSEPSSVTIAYEFVALANHRKGIRTHLAEHGNRLREIDMLTAKRILDPSGLSHVPGLPLILAVLLESLARSFALQQALGVTSGHDEALAAVSRLIDLAGPKV